jgi:hypothetical protein
MAQRDEVVLCSVALRIGMPKSQALPALGKECAVEEAAWLGKGTWCVSGPFRCSNWVRFEDDKLSWVRKDMGSAEGPAAADVLADFIGAIDRIVGGSPSLPDKPTFAFGQATVRVNTTLGKDPDLKHDIVMKELVLIFGQKSLTIQVNRPVGVNAGPIGFDAITFEEDLSKQQ